MNTPLGFGSMTFYREWLPLDKKEFRILAMIADKGEYKGNLSEICEYLSLNPQTKNRNQIGNSIQALVEQDFVDCIKQGRTYTLKAIQKKRKLKFQGGGRSRLFSINTHRNPLRGRLY